LKSTIRNNNSNNIENKHKTLEIVKEEERREKEQTQLIAEWILNVD